MDWWHKMVFPVRRVWVVVAARLKARKNGAGLLKLRDDIQTCGYEDVQVMWKMLEGSDSELMSNHPPSPSNGLFGGSSCGPTPTIVQPHLSPQLVLEQADSLVQYYNNTVLLMSYNTAWLHCFTNSTANI